MPRLLLSLLLALLTSPLLAQPVESQAQTNPAPLDEHSYAQPNRVSTRHIALDLNLDFSKRQLAGTAVLSLDWHDPKATQLVLDSRDLAISRIEGQLASGKWRKLKWSLAAADPILGSALTIETPKQPAQVRITYATSPQASGLQWLTPAQTSGKLQAMMFSQSQQIHARSWVPLQDTSMVRFTYSAHIVAPANAMVLMSANNDPAAVRDGDYTFEMRQKIPSYLLAIAAGDWVFQPITSQSGVWAEPSVVKGAATEFNDVGKMIATAESLYGPYRWERYDMLVLPPSFPYGGMENPRLTFLTPTVIVGDKSLVSVIAHELAHSWSGNLVTFAVSRDAWLNEGITSYVENRIVEVLYGKERADMESLIERNNLRAEFNAGNLDLQPLAIKPGVLKDPDDNLSSTVYTKGAWFMQFLEQRLGRADFDGFLRGYFDHFAFQSITSGQFADYAKANVLDKFPGKLTQAEFDAWLYQPGVPETAPVLASTRFAAVDAAREDWLKHRKTASELGSTDWGTQERVYFIEGLPASLKPEQLVDLDQAFRFTGTNNGEIAQRWYPLTVRSGYFEARPAMGLFLRKIGRRKLIMPTYEELAKTEDGLEFARQAFALARMGYHPITTATVEAVLNKAASAE